MNSKQEGIKFGLAGIQTVEFAIIKEAYKENEENSIQFLFNTTFGVKDEKGNEVMCDIEFALKQTEIPFLKIRVACFFEIKTDSFNNLYNQDENEFVLPKDFANHLIVLTLGTLRGVLHAKTESTPFNKYTIPIIDISKRITEDVTIPLDQTLK